jgi:hypothetical protein
VLRGVLVVQLLQHRQQPAGRVHLEQLADPWVRAVGSDPVREGGGEVGVGRLGRGGGLGKEEERNIGKMLNKWNECL